MPTTITTRPTEAFLGGSKRFKCQVIGNPRPTIRWFKDGIDITNNPRYNFDYTMEGRISMVITSVTYKDEGCYRCRAENSEGIASTASFLMVRGKFSRDGYMYTSINLSFLKSVRRVFQIFVLKLFRTAYGVEK